MFNPQSDIDRAMIIQWFQLCRGVQRDETVTVGMVKREMDNGNLMYPGMDVHHPTDYHLTLSPAAFIELKEKLDDQTPL